MRPLNMLCMKLTILLGTPRFHRLQTSLDGTAFGKAPSISRNSTEVTSPALQEVLILWVRRCSASVVVCPGLSPKWFAGSSCNFSVMWVSWPTISAMSTFHIVFRRAMGLCTFGVSYCSLPGFRSTTVVNCFYGLYSRFLMYMAS